MEKLQFIVVVTALVLLSKGYAQSPVKLLVSDTVTTSPIYSPAEILFGKSVTLRCEFPQITGESYIRRVLLRTESQEDSSMTSEAQCLFTVEAEQGLSEVSIPSTNTLGLKENNVECSNSRQSAEFVIELPLTDRSSYDCTYENVRNSNSQESNVFVIETYSKPSKPVITVDPSGDLTEGNPVSFICTSSARPAPILVFKLAGVTQATSAIVDASPSGTEKQSSVEWNVTADRSMHSQEVRCEVDTSDHPYKKEEIYTTEKPKIIFGPDTEQQAEPTKKFDTNSGVALTLTCVMDGYPLTYEWKDGTESTFNQDLVLESKDYNAIKDVPSHTFQCVGTNSITGDIWTKNYTVDFTATAGSVTPKESMDGNTQTEKDNKLEGKEIVGLVIGVIVFVVIIIIVIVICVVRGKRGSSNHAEKAKAAQARRPSDEKSEDQRFHSSTASFAMPSSTMDRNTYSENATLQMENRYANMGQYADVIDDKPRSRKPIAAFDEMMLDDNAGPPNYDGPPAYVEPHPYRSEPSYSAYSPGYGSSYGAPC